MQRFRDNVGTYITPDNEMVVNAISEVPITPYDTRKDKANKVWEYVYNEVDYKLSRKWNTPQETLALKEGDCEDVAFLSTSMFLALGMQGTKVVAGNLIFPDGRIEEHVWNVVDGMVVDATGPKRAVQGLEYDRIKAWEFNLEVTDERIQ